MRALLFGHMQYINGQPHVLTALIDIIESEKATRDTSAAAGDQDANLLDVQNLADQRMYADKQRTRS